MKEEYHFWYSGEQKKVTSHFCGSYRRDPAIALIRGEEVEYTECSKENNPAGLWDDYKYLGRGTIYKIGGVFQ